MRATIRSFVPHEDLVEAAPDLQLSEKPVHEVRAEWDHYARDMTSLYVDDRRLNRRRYQKSLERFVPMTRPEDNRYWRRPRVVARNS